MLKRIAFVNIPNINGFAVDVDVFEVKFACGSHSFEEMGRKIYGGKKEKKLQPKSHDNIGKSPFTRDRVIRYQVPFVTLCHSAGGYEWMTLHLVGNRVEVFAIE